MTSALITPEWEGSAPGYDLRLTPRSIDSRFLAYQLLGTRAQDQIALAKMRAAQPHLNAEDLGDVEVMSSTPDQERSIADYLDAETARIDAVVRLRLEQRQLADERAFALLSELLVPSDVPMSRLRFMASIQSGLTVDAQRVAGSDGVTRPYLRVANVHADELALDSVTEITVPRGLAARCALRFGDVLMTEGGDLDKLGRGTMWRDELPGALHQNHVFAVRPEPRVLDPEYLALLTRTQHARAYFERTGSKTTGLASTSGEKILGLPVPTLSIERQTRLASDATKQIEQMRAFRSRIGRQTDLLLERRQALITAAVTGLSDIPGVSA